MLNALIPFARTLRPRFPRLYAWLVSAGRRWLGDRLGVYPRLLGGEVSAVTAVLRGSQWNMAYGRGLVHEALEHEFAAYVGAAHAVAVNTGGMAIQMSLRALGLGPGDEVLHQVDTCGATALAVMNAGCTPLFADVSDERFMLDVDDVAARLGPATRAVIATHMWGNPERVDALRALCAERGVRLVEDACLALGTEDERGIVGARGDTGVFSFGCLKPIQAGEGGMIVTNDEALARELRSLRHWGDRTVEYGERDTRQLAWNGRMSEIVAAVAREQLRGYPAHLAAMDDAVRELDGFLAGIDGLSLVTAPAGGRSTWTQLVLRIDERALGRTKRALMTGLTERGVLTWHANFEPITSLSFFAGDAWRRWLPAGAHARAAASYGDAYPGARRVYERTGMGLSNMNLLSPGNLRHLMRQLDALVARGRAPVSEIGVLAVATSENGGSFQYTIAMIEALVTLPQHRVTLFTGGDTAPYARFGLPMVRLPSPARGATAWLGRRFGGRGLFRAMDAVLAPVYSPYLLASVPPFAFTLHDVQERHFPRNFSAAQRIWRHFANTRLTRRATRIICESGFVRSDIMHFFHVPASRVVVIPAPPLGLYQGVRPDAATMAETATRLGLPAEYVLYPAQFWPHKNHRRLFEAFALVLARHPDCHVVLTGERPDDIDSVLPAARELGVAHRVLDIGFVDAADMPVVYRRARAVVVPTLFESISLPIYEAFSLGVPVCASRVVALPEQAGDAALLFDPLAPREIAAAMNALLEDEALRATLVTRGAERIAGRTMARYAEALDEVIATMTRR